MHLEELSAEHEFIFLAMIADYIKNDSASLDLYYQRYYARKKAWSESEFQKYVKELQKQRLDWRPGPGKTSRTRYIMRENAGVICANAVLQFPLDADNEIEGGNLICDVPPSLRGRGYGSYCLSLMLFEAVRAGLSRVLVTCAENDPISRRVIEKKPWLIARHCYAGLIVCLISRLITCLV